MSTPLRIAILHGAGYVGGELIRLLLTHPYCTLTAVTSRTFAGQPLWRAHPTLRGQTDLTFVEEAALTLSELDAVLIAAEHGQGARTVQRLLENGYQGLIIDLSADFRFRDAARYPEWFGFDHPAPELLGRFVYGLPEVYAPYAPGTRLLANPGCFATGLALALWPLRHPLRERTVAVTALTGASGSGTRPKATTHFPERDGNVRAYKVLTHQHLPEVQQVVGPYLHIAFVPVSGPWTRGIWGTVHVTLPAGITTRDVSEWYEAAYGEAPFVRLWPDQLPELRYAVHTPFCDLGWVVRHHHLVVGFALDNLLKGAASQAIQNLNLLLGLPQTAGLLPTPAAVDA
ncbi:N-acetyl-gamma-glutamyl-phosphate reductase [Rhodothermus profundi]|nr:N-acetyl-gamma-glutamyl-phosphate reductase [Rhodothermus profundi]